MKIKKVKTFVVSNPPPHYGGLYWVFVKLTTDSGIHGYGEVYSVPFHPHTVVHMVEDVCERHVIGRDPFKIEKMWRIIYSSGFTQRPDTSIAGILSGIEMACWDIIGKELDKPIYELGVMPFLFAEFFKIALLTVLTKKILKFRKFI